MKSYFSNGVHDPRFNQRSASHINFLMQLQSQKAHQRQMHQIKKKTGGFNKRNSTTTHELDSTTYQSTTYQPSSKMIPLGAVMLSRTVDNNSSSPYKSEQNTMTHQPDSEIDRLLNDPDASMNKVSRAILLKS